MSRNQILYLELMTKIMNWDIILRTAVLDISFEINSIDGYS